MASPDTIRYRPTWPQGKFAGVRAMEDDIARKVNALRAERGLPALTTSERLRVAARQHTQEMIKRGYYEHNSPVRAWRRPVQRACRAGYLDSYITENLAYTLGMAQATIAPAMVKSWRHSPGHYKNIIDKRVTQTGVGVASFMRQGRLAYYATQLFGQPLLDLRKLTLRRKRDRALSLSVFLGGVGTMPVKVLEGRRFLRSVTQVGGKAIFTTDVALPLSKERLFRFAVKYSAAKPPLICADITIKRDTSVHIRRNTWSAPCKPIKKVITATWRYTRMRWVLHGEAKALEPSARSVRYYFNEKWGPHIATRLGRWVRFSRALSSPRTLFSLVVGKLQKDYLRLVPDSHKPFRCP